MEDDPPPPPPPTPTLSAAREASCQRATQSGNLFAETAQARGEPGAVAPSPALARAVAAARISQDAGLARELLMVFVVSEDQATAGQARIFLAQALVRTAPLDLGKVAQEVRDLLSPADRFAENTDALYIRSVLLANESKYPEAIARLNKAITLNPKFYNAVMYRAILQMRQADSGFRNRGDCRQLTADIVSSVVPVATLGACPLQLAHFRLALDRHLPPATSPRRNEMLRATELALAFAARKDALHREILTDMLTNTDGGYSCGRELARHDFGNPLE
ncbi:MAG: hypothetical protein AAF393_07465 [Pseudomonadota bacterium]